MEHLVLSSDQAGNPNLISNWHVEEAELPTLYAQNHRIVQVLKDLRRPFNLPLWARVSCKIRGQPSDWSFRVTTWIIQSFFLACYIFKTVFTCSITPLGVCFFCQTMVCYSKLLCMFVCQKGQTRHCRFKAGTVSKSYTGHVECHATIFTFPVLYEVSLFSFFFFLISSYIP